MPQATPRQNAPLRRAFTVDDLRPVPPGHRIAPPDFVGIGVNKSGTTWFYRMLREHPSIVPNRLGRKELKYFCFTGTRKVTEEQIETYQQAFASPPGAICGEWTPVYLTFPYALENLARAAPETKLLVMVRNPVDHAFSAFNQWMRTLDPDLARQERLPPEIRSFPHYSQTFFQGLLSHRFKKLLEFYDRSRLLFLQYEWCKYNPLDAIQKVYRFLGVDATFVPPSLSRAVNKHEYVIDPKDQEMREAIADYHAIEVRALLELFPEIDLSLWKDFDATD